MNSWLRSVTYRKHWQWFLVVLPLWFVASAVASVQYHNAFRGTAFETVSEEIMGLLAGMSLGCLVAVSLLFRELSRSRDALIEASRRDLATGLLNHGAIVGELRGLPQLGGSHALLMADVDGLKRVNDLYGHIAGDKVLTAVAGCLAQGDAIVGRYGGDEFLSILKNVSRAEAEGHRENVRTALLNTRVFDPLTGDTIQVQASLGIAMFPDEASEISDALALSDEAMYAMKRQRPVGRDTNREKYQLNVERLTGILGAFSPLLSDETGIEDKLEGLAHRLLWGTGVEAIVVTLWPDQGAPPVVRTALASADRALELQHNAFFESLPYDEQPVWQQLRRSRRPVIVNDFETDWRFSEEDRAPARAAGMRSALIMPLNAPGAIIGALYIASREESSFGPADIQFFSAVADHVVAVATTSSLLEEVRRGAARLAAEQEATVMRLAAAAEAHSSTVGTHLGRVRELAELLALEVGFDPAHAHKVGLAAALHDVGKLYVPEALLASTAVLSIEEKRQFQKHTYLGARFLDGPGMELASQVARSHHERWDGGGYPDGLQGEEIPEAARITTVADALDSMTHDRSYQLRRSLESAVAEISALAGKQFSPEVVDALMSLYRRGVLREAFSAVADQADAA